MQFLSGFSGLNPILVVVLACFAAMLALTGLIGVFWLLDSICVRLIGVRGAIFMYVLLFFFGPAVFFSNLAFFVKLQDPGYMYSALVSFAVLVAILVRAFLFFSQRSIVFMATEDDRPIIFFTPKSARKAVDHAGKVADQIKSLPELQGVMQHVNLVGWFARLFSGSQKRNRGLGPQSPSALLGPSQTDNNSKIVESDNSH